MVAGSSPAGRALLLLGRRDALTCVGRESIPLVAERPWERVAPAALRRSTDFALRSWGYAVPGGAFDVECDLDVALILLLSGRFETFTLVGRELILLGARSPSCASTLH